MKKKTFLLILFIVCSLTITLWLFNNESKEITKAFYFWESDRNQLSEFEKNTLKKTNTKKVYVKFFEVELNETFGIIPVEKNHLNFSSFDNLNIEIIPTIYIRNDVFKEHSKLKLVELAENIVFLVSKKIEEQFKEIHQPIQEIQIDCDWTESSQKNYFYFLEKLKALSKKKLSATLRLYAYKFPDKMGILPVDRAMLMCYNLISPNNSKNKNSILELDELEKYLIGANEYPISLDVALPIYSAVYLYKNNQFVGVFYNEDTEFVNNLIPQNKLWFKIKKDTVFNEIYLRKNDLIKYEKISIKDLSNAIEIIKKNVILDGKTNIALFNLTETEIKHYTNEEINSIFNHFNY